MRGASINRKVFIDVSYRIVQSVYSRTSEASSSLTMFAAERVVIEEPKPQDRLRASLAD